MGQNCMPIMRDGAATQSDDVYSNVLKQSNAACKELLLCVSNGTQSDPMKQCRAIEDPDDLPIHAELYQFRDIRRWIY